MEGWVFNIQRFSLHDGPGIRTTVFLKGCQLRCRWCHNPEGLEQAPQVRLTTNLCQRCGRCAAACELGGHEVDAGAHHLHLVPCIRCGKCIDACVVGALEMVGTHMTVDDVLAVVRRDEPFYTQSGGGMTLSGGEPLQQYAFTHALLTSAKAEGMHTAIETSAATTWKRLETLAPLLDLWLVDLKHTDNARHRTLTGIANTRILANIRRIVAAGWPLLLRIPWVPQQNADASFLDGLASFLADFPNPPAVEFMPYHRLGIGKWTALGGETIIPDDIPAATRDEIEPWAERLRELGVVVKVG